MVTAMNLKVGKVVDDGDKELPDPEWTDLFYYVSVNYRRLRAEGRLNRLIHRLNYLAGYSKVDPLSIKR